MKMKIKLLYIFLFIIIRIFGQFTYWTPSSDKIDHAILPDDRIPSRYQTYEIDFNKIKDLLAQAPRYHTNIQSNIRFTIPDENGKEILFTVYQSGTLSEELKASSPDIATYRAYASGAIASITTTMFGLHIGILRPGKSTLIVEPVSNDLNKVIVFEKKFLAPVSFECYVTDYVKFSPEKENDRKINDEILRTYRFGVGTTGEYSAYHINRAINAGIISANASDSQKKDVVLAAVTVTIDRVNSIYERDFGVLLTLVSNERDVIFLDANSDPYNNDDIISMLNNNTNVLNTNLGSANYDGGHLFSTYPYGGVSRLGIICSSNKAASVTGSTQPIGDAYDIDYVAHEIGHAFGCNHTFANSCSGNRNLNTSVEPGSGSTIMAYAGVCSPNVQIHSDDYFHNISIAEAENFITNYATCSTNTNIGNHTPVISVTNYGSVYIPKSTPFMLQATATDPDNNDVLSYCWEQIDAATSGNVSNWYPDPNRNNGPLFRSYNPKENGIRYFPQIYSIYNGTYGNTWEKLPAVNRSMNFTVTVRDNHTGGGQSPYNSIIINVDDSTGPFRITNMDTNETWQAGENKTITWNVAGTDGGQVNCNTIDILFSADNGETFSYVVADNIPNNGSAQFTVPNYQNTTSGRFMIKAHNNYFFDIAHGTFTIQGANNIEDLLLNNIKIYPNPAKNKIMIVFKTVNLSNDIKIALFDISGRKIFSKTFAAENNFKTTVNLQNFARGIYLIKITNGNHNISKKIILQ
jgi:hypothetical protein